MLQLAGGTGCCPELPPQPGLTLTQFEAVPKMPSGCPGQVQQQTAAGRTRAGQDRTRQQTTSAAQITPTINVTGQRQRARGGRQWKTEQFINI